MDVTIFYSTDESLSYKMRRTSETLTERKKCYSFSV